MKLYQFLTNAKFLKNYTTKFLFVTFLGIHIPLIGVVILLLATSNAVISKSDFFLFTLGLTLLATGITLAVLYKLLSPLKIVQASLTAYIQKQVIPDLPGHYKDEIGILMRDINTVVSVLHNNVMEKNEVIQALSHDLRSPATTILALIPLMRDENDPYELAKYINNIEDSINKQLHVMDSMVYGYEIK